MTGSTLSPRLRAVAEHVLPGEPMADIGTDHARVPAWLVAHGVVPRAIACDRAAGPLAAARRTVGTRAAIELRKGDGLGAIEPGEVATVVLAGMGGPLLRRLIARDADRLAGVRRLVLQPNNEWTQTRRFIAERPWHLHAETIVEDAGHFYVVLAVDLDGVADGARWAEADLVFGPLLRRRRPHAFLRWLEHERTRLARAHAAATTARDPAVTSAAGLRAQLERVEAELNQ